MEEGTLDHALLLRALSQPFPCKSLLGTRSTPPQWSSTACPSVLLCAVLGSCALGHLGGRKLISPGSITALSGLRDHEAELPPEFVPPPPAPRPVSTFLLAPGVHGGPTGTALWSVRASGEAVVVPPRDRAPSHRPSPSSPGSSFPHVHASGLFQSKLPGVCSARSLVLKHSCDHDH